MAKVTLDTIASLAHVSRATVSRVLNNHPNISPEVRSRVLAVMEQQAYVPNVAARGLAGKRTMNVGVVVLVDHPTYLSHEIFYEILVGIQEVLTDTDYDLLLYAGHGDADQQFCRRILAKSQVDGLIVMGELVGPHHLEWLEEGGLPIVTVGRKDGPPVPYVADHAIQGARKAVQHLIQLGHRRIGMLRGLPGLQPGADRHLGYQAALEEAGIPYDPALTAHGGTNKAQGAEGMAQLLALPEPPTAVFAWADPAAIGAMEYARSRGLRIPDDIAVVGYADIQSAAMVQPALTTVRQPRMEMGRQASRLLINLLSGAPTVTGGVYLDPELMVRESCGAPRKEA